MNKKGVHLVGRDICSPLPLTIVLSNVVLRCRNQMDNALICLKKGHILPENVFHHVREVMSSFLLPCVCSTSR